MNYLELMKKRHSVRQYLDKPIPEDIIALLDERIKKVNEESRLNFRLITNEKKAFGGMLPKYGSFRNVQNYIICSGIGSPDFEEKYGYYGEDLVLYAQSLGLNTCWVGLTVSKKIIKSQISELERLGCVIALGYGQTQGMPHKNKDVAKVTNIPSPWPTWLHDGILGAMLAPTAVNQQRFFISLTPEGKVKIEATGGFYSQVDLGIVKYQFEKAAGKDFPGFAE